MNAIYWYHCPTEGGKLFIPGTCDFAEKKTHPDVWADPCPKLSAVVAAVGCRG